MKPQENPRKSSRSPGETVSSRKDQKAVSQHSSSQQQYCAAGVAKRVDPAALPLGSMRSRTQIAFSRQRRLALAEIHGVESPKRGAEFHFPQICTTPIRNACFLHKWPSGLTAGGGSRHAQPVSSGLAWLQHGAKKSIKTCNCRNFQGLGLQKHATVVICSA